MYERVTTPESAPILLLYGQSGVGKSSLLAAGLLPRLEDAESVLRQGLDIRLEKLGAEHWQTGEAKSMLGRCLTALNRYDEAEPLLLDGYRTLEQALGAEDRNTLTALRRLVALYEASDQSAKASQYRALLG